MKINYEGTEYNFDLEEITVQQARTIKSQCGLTLMALEDGLEGGDPDALRAIFWLMLCQHGETTDIDRVDFKIVKFAVALAAAQAPPAEDAEDPKGSAAEVSPQ